MPIIHKAIPSAMEFASCVLYTTGELNKSGNTLIVGHNYQNGTLFSDNYKLKIGDKIYVTTLDQKKIEYTIYDKFMTTPEDVSFLKREIKDKPEITISTCSDDEVERLVILAR